MVCHAICQIVADTPYAAGYARKYNMARTRMRGLCRCLWRHVDAVIPTQQHADRLFTGRAKCRRDVKPVPGLARSDVQLLNSIASACAEHQIALAYQGGFISVQFYFMEHDSAPFTAPARQAAVRCRCAAPARPQGAFLQRPARWQCLFCSRAFCRCSTQGNSAGIACHKGHLPF